LWTCIEVGCVQHAAVASLGCYTRGVPWSCSSVGQYMASLIEQWAAQPAARFQHCLFDFFEGNLAPCQFRFWCVRWWCVTAAGAVILSSRSQCSCPQQSYSRLSPWHVVDTVRHEQKQVDNQHVGCGAHRVFDTVRGRTASHGGWAHMGVCVVSVISSVLLLQH
jgi:hypothetical protein